MAHVRPKALQHVVLSVPHSGTRTLQSWLAEQRPETIHEQGYMDVPHHWHFNFHPHHVMKFFLYAEDLQDGRMAHIPIRNPFNVCDSWERRYGPAPDKQFDFIWQAITLMVRVVNDYPQHLKTYKMEELPVIRGFGPKPEGWSKEQTLESQRFKDVRSHILQMPEVEGFYRKYYNAEELWWL